MRCDDAIVKMNMYLDGELPASQISELLAHIESCPECSRRFDGLKTVAFEMRGLSDSPPESLHAKIMEGINAHAPKKKRNVKKIAFSLVGTAAVVTLLVTGVFSSLRQIYIFGALENGLFSKAPSADRASASGSTTADAPTADAAPAPADPPMFIQAPDLAAGQSADGAGSPEDEESTFDMEAALSALMVPEGFRKYVIAVGQSDLPEALAAESSLERREDAKASLITLLYSEDAFNDTVATLLESGFEVLSGHYDALPEADLGGSQMLVIVFEQ